MSQACDARILVEAESAEADRWVETLRQAGAKVWRGGQQLPAGEEADVVLTDAAEFTADEAADFGVVRIGAAGPADVHLPKDCSARELRLACALLAQVVRHRRRERVADGLHRKLSVAALTDPLTGLPNRRAWDAVVPERLALAVRSPWRLGLAILDLDYFKRVNDTRGHAVGDSVLREAGRTVHGGLRHEDFVARLGGDEFGMLLWVPNESMAAKVVDRVRAALPTRLARVAAVSVTASAGFHVAECRFAPGPPTPEALFTAADVALREAKRQGRNRTVGHCGE